MTPAGRLIAAGFHVEQDDAGNLCAVGKPRKTEFGELRYMRWIHPDDVPENPTEDSLSAAPTLMDHAEKSTAPTYLGQECSDAKGRTRFADHGLGNDMPCIPDYADEAGRRHWPDYVMTKDPRTGRRIEGPKPFRSADERRSYERLTGLRQRG